MSENNQRPDLVRSLGTLAVVAMVVGSVVGSGIFKKPAVMADGLGSPEWLMAVWVIAGIVTLFGALTNAEIAGILPSTGGQYQFFRKMYGDFVGYLYGWAVFVVIQTGSIASITYVFSEYSQYFWSLPRFSKEIEDSVVWTVPFIGTLRPLADIGVKCVTIGLITFLTTINYLGVKFGGAVQVLFTGLKLAAIFFLVAAAFLFGSGNGSNFVTDSTSAPSGTNVIMALVAALSAAFWAYDGWNNITYVAGEVKNPQRSIPRGLVIGTLVIIGTYVLVNLAYLYVLPVDVMARSKLVASDVAQVALGDWGGAFVAAAVMVSTFGTSNGTILASARVYFAMAHERAFFRSMGNVQPRFRTPAHALFLQAGWAILLVLTGTFDTLTDMLIFVSWIFYALGAIGIFILRKKMSDVTRPYRVPGYPIIPAIFVVFATFFVILTLYNDIDNYLAGKSQMVNSLFGLALVAIGVPLYFLFRRRGSDDQAQSQEGDPC